MSVEWCTHCGDIMYNPPIGEPHRCPPKFEVIYEDYDPTHIWKVFARDYEEAAERWAVIYDQDDHDIANQTEEPEIKIRCHGEVNWVVMKVTGKIVAEYQATTVKEEIEND